MTASKKSLWSVNLYYMNFFLLLISEEAICPNVVASTLKANQLVIFG